MRLVAIGYEYATGCHDNGNVGLHVCAKFHEHTYTVLCAHNVIYVHRLRLVAIGYEYVTLP